LRCEWCRFDSAQLLRWHRLYNTGHVCPIVGAGGSGGTCTVTAVGGALTGCSAIGGGSNYADERIVKIGGRAEAAVTVDVLGAVTSITITNRGCGYGAAPTIQIIGCTVAPTFTVDVTAGGAFPVGQVEATIATAGSGCPVGAKVVVGEDPFSTFSDGASAIVDTITGGRLTFVSTSEASVNAAQLIQLIDRDATGITSAHARLLDYLQWYNAEYFCARSDGAPAAPWRDHTCGEQQRLFQ
jgi:hypothetical protein